MLFLISLKNFSWIESENNENKLDCYHSRHCRMYSDPRKRNRAVTQTQMSNGTTTWIIWPGLSHTVKNIIILYSSKKILTPVPSASLNRLVC